MKRAEKAQKIMEILDELYPNPPIPLQHRDPFTLLIAVLLSAHTTDAQVNRATPALFTRAPTVEKMTKLSIEEIYELIRNVGLAAAKARHIHGLCQMLIHNHDGQVPQTFAELEALPGVGHKTASVVMAQAFDEPAFPVDTHIHRLAARWGLSDGRSVEKTEQDLKTLFPQFAWSHLHLQIIYFGREYCPARSHDFSQCPICSWAASKKRIEEEKAKWKNAAAKRASQKRISVGSRK